MLPAGPNNPKDYEADILNFWLSNKFYKPEYDPILNRVVSTEEMKLDKREPWTLICPPPNAYARPHIGNISGYAYQDAMARYQRMKGKKVLVIPGKDHAGLEGEGVFVREVLEKQGRKKFDMKRDEFYSEMMEFFKKNMDIARNDEKNIGLSADFDRDIFTLDERVVNTVLETFVEMFNKGMIYKGVRIVNWDPKARTAVADNQTLYEDAVTPFFYFKYSLGQIETKALELRDKFIGKGTLWKVHKSNDKVAYLEGERHDGTKIIGITYDKVPVGTEVAGEVIGIQMRLDGDFRIVVKSNDFEGDLDSEIIKASNDMFKETAGAHIILFNKYKEDKYYTNGFIIGTVRPETIFGDTAIACDPKDERYKDFVGTKVEVEFLGTKKRLSFISDYSVDKDFGTGLLKITPAHSVEDWEISNRHKEECLPPIQVIGYDLKLNHLAGKYEGQNIKVAREAIRDDMEKEGNLIYVDESYKNRIKIAERTKAPIEPLLSSQWYLKYDKDLDGRKSIKEAAIQMVKEGSVTIHPESMVQKFDHWMDNLRDWAISRSLWWGYRLPVWYAGEVKEEISKDGLVRELIKIDSEWVPLEYDNPGHVRVQIQNPNSSKIYLVPGKHGYMQRRIYPDLLTKFQNAEIVEVENLTEPKLNDYSEALKFKALNKNSIVVAHSIGCEGILNYLNDSKLKIKHLIVIAPSTKNSSNLDKWTEAGFWNFEKSYTKVAERITLIYSDNDENSNNDPKTFESFGELIDADELIMEPNKRHYAGPDYDFESEALNDLLSEYTLSGSTWTQDENVLDTWFSSGQWVYATLSAHNLMDTFFPSNVLVSAHDILENWDSRMMMFTYFKHNTIPFKDLYLTGLVLGTDGQKMSKSKGNMIDMDKVISEFGTDSVRMSYFYQNSAGGHYAITPDKLKNFKQFNNKIWNAAKFVLMNVENIEVVVPNDLSTLTDLKLDLSKEILGHIKAVKQKVTKNIDNFEFGYATETLYNEFWHTFCDKYIEEAKKYLMVNKNWQTGEILSEPNPSDKAEMASVMVFVLKEYLKMLHPFIPFITERIWSEVPKTEGDHKCLMYSVW